MFLQTSPWHALLKRYKLIIFSGVVLAIVVMALLWVLSFLRIMPLQYRADAEVLIISQSRYGVDPYTAAKSAERVGENLVQVMKTSDFYQKTLSQGKSLDVSQYEKLSELNRRKLWQKNVTGNVVYGTSVLNVSAYNKNPEEAKKWAGAAAEVLATRGWEYVGGDVVMKVVNEPVATKWPVRPNLFLNALLGFVVGGLLMAWKVLK